MKKYLLLLFILSLAGCKSKTVYVPVESVKTEYRDNLVRDSIFRYDSVFVKDRGDTVFLEKFRYLYRDKLVRDSVFVSDTIKVPFPVEVEKPVKYVSGLQNFQIWCGRILIALLIGYAGYRVVKRKFSP